MSALDTQVDGNHYKDMAIQPMEFSMANNLDACQHTIIKYVCRFRAKGGIRDLEKAKHVIDMMIELEGKAQEASKALLQGIPTSVPTFGPLNLGLDGCSDPGRTQCYPVKEDADKAPLQEFANALDGLLRGAIGNTVSLKQVGEDAKNQQARVWLKAIPLKAFTHKEIQDLASQFRADLNGNT